MSYGLWQMFPPNYLNPQPLYYHFRPMQSGRRGVCAPIITAPEEVKVCCYFFVHQLGDSYNTSQ
jgi:hypothetical protein